MLARELAEDGPVTDALRPNTGSHRVEPGLGGRDRDLRSESWLARDRSYLHRARLDLGHLRLQQTMNEHARGTRNANLCLARVALSIQDHHEHRPARMQELARDLLLRRHHAFGPSEVDVNRAIFGPVHDTGGELAAMFGHVAKHLVPLQVGDVPEDCVL